MHLPVMRENYKCDIIAGRELSAAADRGVYPGRGQVVSLRQFSNNQGQAGPDQTLEAGRRRLCS